MNIYAFCVCLCVSANLNNFPTLNYRVFSVGNKVFCARVFHAFCVIGFYFGSVFGIFRVPIYVCVDVRGLVFGFGFGFGFGNTLISFNKPTPPRPAGLY